MLHGASNLTRPDEAQIAVSGANGYGGNKRCGGTGPEYVQLLGAKAIGEAPTRELDDFGPEHAAIKRRGTLHVGNGDHDVIKLQRRRRAGRMSAVKGAHGRGPSASVSSTGLILRTVRLAQGLDACTIWVLSEAQVIPRSRWVYGRSGYVHEKAQ